MTGAVHVQLRSASAHAFPEGKLAAILWHWTTNLASRLGIPSAVALSQDVREPRVAIVDLCQVSAYAVGGKMLHPVWRKWIDAHRTTCRARALRSNLKGTPLLCCRESLHCREAPLLFKMSSDRKVNKPAAPLGDAVCMWDAPHCLRERHRYSNKIVLHWPHHSSHAVSIGTVVVSIGPRQTSQ